MRTAQPGDRVQVHYVIRSQDGSVVSSRGRAPLGLIVGTEHPRLPGLGTTLVGLTPGQGATVTVPAERAYGLPDATRVRRCSRGRFPEHAVLRPGILTTYTDGRGRKRQVRVVRAGPRVVVVDANHRWAGQSLNLEVELVAISDLLPARGRALVFDADEATLVGLQETLPGWDLEVVRGASAGSLSRGWDPGVADLLVVSAGTSGSQTLGLCRFLAFCTSYSAEARRSAESPGLRAALRKPTRADVPLLVLVPPGQETLVGAALEAGAWSCLMLPVRTEDLAGILAQARAGNQPGRHTGNLDRAQEPDRWRDGGGEG